MKRTFRNLLISCLLTLLFASSLQMQVLAAPSWSTAESATASGGVITLTGSEYDQIGGYLNSVPLDTRNGFSISFDYRISSDYFTNNSQYCNFQLLFANVPIVPGEYAYLGYSDYIYNNISSHEFVSFCALGFCGGQRIATISNDFGDYTDEREMTACSIDLVYDTWYNVRAVYDTKTLTVYQNGAKLFSCPDFKPSDLSYVGFTAQTGYYITSTSKQQIRNISISCAEASLVHLNTNGGSCEKEAVYVLKNSKGSLPKPTREGYKFSGWYTKKSGGTKISDTNYNFRSVQTVYAHWTPKIYTVKFQANGGSCTQSDATVTYSKAYGTLPTATRTGYKFSGWYTQKSGGTKITSKSKVSTAKTHKLYAHWTAKKYKVAFNANGGTLSSSEKIRYVKYSKKIGSLPSPTRTGYAFLGWYTKKSGGTKITSSRVVKAKTTFYAHWAKNSAKVTIKLNKNSGSCSKTSITTTYGGKLGTLPKATRSGYTFLGWYTKKSGGTKVSASTKTIKVLQYTKTLYAHWKTTSSGSSGSGSSSGTTYSPNCVFCHGSGRCSRCGGAGLVYSYALKAERLNCYKCSATGRCFYCHGTGKRY